MDDDDEEEDRGKSSFALNVSLKFFSCYAQNQESNRLNLP